MDSVTYIQLTKPALDKLLENAINTGIKAFQIEISKREFLNTKQVAEELNIAVSTVKQRIHSKKCALIGIRNGRNLQVSRYNLERYKESLK